MKALESPRLFQKKSFELDMKNMDVNGVWLEQVAPAVYIKVIFTLLVGLWVRDDWLESRGTNPYRTCHCLKIFLGVPDGSCSGD